MSSIASPARRRLVSGLLSVPLLPVAAAFSSVSSNSPASAQSIDRPAPQWDIVEWINGDGGNIDQLRGKVIVIDFFQLWCPGCNKFSGPLMSHWQQKYAAEIAGGDMTLVKIHTVFEGHSYQSAQKLRGYLKQKSITMPVGIDRHRGDDRIPVTMRRYRTRGTPEVVVIDQKGLIRFQQIGYFDHRKVEGLIAQLLGRKRA